MIVIFYIFTLIQNTSTDIIATVSFVVLKHVSSKRKYIYSVQLVYKYIPILVGTFVGAVVWIITQMAFFALNLPQKILLLYYYYVICQFAIRALDGMNLESYLVEIELNHKYTRSG
jgi:hypothetical protein